MSYIECIQVCDHIYTKVNVVTLVTQSVLKYVITYIQR